MGYEGTYIYLLQYNYTFQYLFAWNNEVYRQEINVTPRWSSWYKLMWIFGRREFPYSQDQIDQSEQVILSGAMKSIDLLRQDKSGIKRRQTEKKAKNNSRDTKCQWQARADEDGKPIFLCLTHDKVAPVNDNPHHE